MKILESLRTSLFGRRRRPLKASITAVQADGSIVEEWMFPQWPPPPPSKIIERREEYRSKLRHRKYAAPKGVYEDSPLYALYRIYEYIVVDYVIGYRNHIELFWKERSWAICDIPDPMDDDPERYAYLSCIPRLLLEAFNERIKVGLARDAPAIMTEEEIEYYQTLPESSKIYEKLPPWVENVPPLDETLVIPTYDNIVLDSFEDERADPNFKAVNILTWGPHIHFT